MGGFHSKKKYSNFGSGTNTVWLFFKLLYERGQLLVVSDIYLSVSLDTAAFWLGSVLIFNQKLINREDAIMYIQKTIRMN